VSPDRVRDLMCAAYTEAVGILSGEGEQIAARPLSVIMRVLE